MRSNEQIRRCCANIKIVDSRLYPPDIVRICLRAPYMGKELFKETFRPAGGFKLDCKRNTDIEIVKHVAEEVNQSFCVVNPANLTGLSRAR